MPIDVSLLRKQLKKTTGLLFVPKYSLQVVSNYIDTADDIRILFKVYPRFWLLIIEIMIIGLMFAFRLGILLILLVMTLFRCFVENYLFVTSRHLFIFNPCRMFGHVVIPIANIDSICLKNSYIMIRHENKQYKLRVGFFTSSKVMVNITSELESIRAAVFNDHL